MFLDRHRFAGQRGLVGLKVDSFEDSQIGGNPVAHLEKHDVAGNDIAGPDDGLVAVAEHACGWSRHLPERLDRPLRTILLDEAEEGCEHDDDTDDDRFDPVSQRRRQSNGDQQDDDEDIPELGCEQHPRRGPLRLLEFIGTDRGKAANRLWSCKPMT